MTTTITTQNKKTYEVELNYKHSFAGYGHWSVECTVYFKGQSKTFKHTTTDSETIDLLHDADDTQALYHDAFGYSFEERIAEWLYFINE